MVSVERIENQRLVSLRNMSIGESSLVGQIHLNGYSTSDETGCLGVDLHVNSLGGLNTEDKLVASNVVENSLGDIFVLDANFYLGFVQGC